MYICIGSIYEIATTIKDTNMENNVSLIPKLINGVNDEVFVKDLEGLLKPNTVFNIFDTVKANNQLIPYDGIKRYISPYINEVVYELEDGTHTTLPMCMYHHEDNIFSNIIRVTSVTFIDDSFRYSPSETDKFIKFCFTYNTITGLGHADILSDSGNIPSAKWIGYKLGDSDAIMIFSEKSVGYSGSSIPDSIKTKPVDAALSIVRNLKDTMDELKLKSMCITREDYGHLDTLDDVTQIVRQLFIIDITINEIESLLMKINKK